MTSLLVLSKCEVVVDGRADCQNYRQHHIVVRDEKVWQNRSDGKGTDDEGAQVDLKVKVQ